MFTECSLNVDVGWQVAAGVGVGSAVSAPGGRQPPAAIGPAGHLRPLRWHRLAPLGAQRAGRHPFNIKSNMS